VGNRQQTETVSLNFAKVTVDYTPQKADGDAGTKKHSAEIWPLIANSREHLNAPQTRALRAWSVGLIAITGASNPKNNKRSNLWQ